MFIFLNLFYLNFLWFKPYTEYLCEHNHLPSFSRFKKLRFFKPVTAYFFELNSKAVILNLYYATTLEKFQAMSGTLEEEKEDLDLDVDSSLLDKLFFLK